jgi:hypothetical protein
MSHTRTVTRDDLAIAHWRLTQSLQDSRDANAPATRHALRKIADLLAAWRVEARSMDGVAYDPGLNAHVVDRVHDPAVPTGADIIIETLSPLILLDGQVIRTPEVIVATAP